MTYIKQPANYKFWRTFYSCGLASFYQLDIITIYTDEAVANNSVVFNYSECYSWKK